MIRRKMNIKIILFNGVSKFVRLTILLLICTSVLVCGTLQDAERYLGVGYNLLKGNPDGGEWSQLGQDPGLLLTYSILKLETNGPSYIKYQQYPDCHEVSSTMIFYGGKSYQEYMLQYFTFSDNSTVDDYAFTTNPLYLDIKHKTVANKDIFRDNITSCIAEHARYATPVANTDLNLVTPEFAAAVCNLPVTYDADTYKQFLDTWGTHVTVEVDLGHKKVIRYRQSASQISQVILDSHDASVHAGTLREETYERYGSVVELNLERFQHSDYANVPLGAQLVTFQLGSATHQVPISWRLMPISEVLNRIYWMDLGTLTDSGSCQTNIGNELDQYKLNLEVALRAYPDMSGGEIPQNEIIKIPVTWPTGTYGFMRPNANCPNDPAGFVTGWIKQDSEDTSNKNHWSTGIHLRGTFDRHYIVTEYCIKDNTIHGDYDRNWPEGNYCILLRNSCPTGFQSGYIKWDDEDGLNKNDYGGILPHGTYDKNTLIYYCCRQDGHYQTPILLPIDKPFYLMRYTSPCQHVIGMNVTDEYIFFDNEDTNNQDDCFGSHPYDALGCDHDKEIHYCYYHREDTSPIKIGGAFG